MKLRITPLRNLYHFKFPLIWSFGNMVMIFYSKIQTRLLFRSQKQMGIFIFSILLNQFGLLLHQLQSHHSYCSFQFIGLLTNLSKITPFGIIPTLGLLLQICQAPIFSSSLFEHSHSFINLLFLESITLLTLFYAILFCSSLQFTH